KNIYNSSEELKSIGLFKDVFNRFWVESNLPEASSTDFNVLAVDSSSRYIDTGNGGIFYVVRALGITSFGADYRRVHSDFDYCFNGDCENVIGRVMEWLEHLVALEALENGFRGFILLDGSIYGRFSHVPLETGLSHDRGFMVKYFEDLLNLFNLARRFNVPIIGVSKMSSSSFFRNFLIGVLAVKVARESGFNVIWVRDLLNNILDRRRSALLEVEKLPTNLKNIVREFLYRKPDFQLILEYARSTGYTMPLLLNPPPRTLRAFKLMDRNPITFLKSAFPISCMRDGFMDWALNVVKHIPKLPAVISFHILPSISDVPIRVDVPAWVFGFEDGFIDFNWPIVADVDLNDILKLISSGYCGLDNYNVWLTSVDRMVRLTRRVFENIYLPKFEDIVGRFVTSRGYRRVRYP
ncbi:MAG: DNA double-strand break repair nuclease NurA, partial [Candidatus Methanomethylicia archaeon]